MNTGKKTHQMEEMSDSYCPFPRDEKIGTQIESGGIFNAIFSKKQSYRHDK